MVDLKGVYIVTAKGRPYHYAWRGGPRIKAPPGTDAYVRELAEHRAARHGGDPERISGLIVDWKTSDAWTLPPEKGGLAASTRKAWKGPLDEVQRHFGGVRIGLFDDPACRLRIKRWRNQWKDRPRSADMHKQVLSALLSYGFEEGRLKSNLCFGVPNLYRSDRSEIIWTADDIEAFAKVAPIELVWALKLACLTGLRQSDLLKLSWSHVGDLAIEMKTGKSRVRGRGQRAAVVPLYAELRTLLAEIPKRATTVLTSTEHRPWKTGFSSSWNKAKKLVEGRDLPHFHDARGSFATTTYELDVFTVKELAEMLAWSEDKVERIINRYVRRDALLRDKIRRLDEAKVLQGDRK